MQDQKTPKFSADEALQRLRGATDTLREARLAYNRRADWAARTCDQIKQTAWTARIEKALDDDVVLARLRGEYDESSISAMSALLSEFHAFRQVMNARTAISAAIQDAIDAHDTVTGHYDGWLKALLEAAVIAAAEEHHTNTDRRRTPGPRDGEIGDLEQYMYRAFKQLQQSKFRCGSYPDTQAVVGRDFVPHLNPDVELRQVFAVEFEDCVNSTHPHNAALWQRLCELEEALKEARDIQRSFSRSEKGSVNERQHAARMIAFLHDDSADRSIRAKSLVDAQSERRWRYELQRAELLAAIKKLTAARTAVAEALQPALDEATELVELTRQRSSGEVIITVDKYDTARIMMNNALAADVRLRAVGRELKELYAVHRDDVADRAGETALHAKYEKVSRSYAPYSSLSGTGSND